MANNKLLYQKEYYTKNKEILMKKHREYYHKNRDKMLEKQIQYNQKPEVKARNRIYRREYMMARGQKMREKAVKHYNKVREYLFNILGSKCAVCGYDKYRCALDIDHINPALRLKRIKHRSIDSWTQLKHENLDNLMVLCANCHRAKTFGKLKIEKVDNQITTLLISER